MEKHTLQDFLDITPTINPTFNNDMSKVAFLNNTSGTFQIYIHDTTTKISTRITDLPNRVMFCRYSPTEDMIIYGTDAGGDEKIQLFLYDEKTKLSKKITNNDSAIYKFGGWSKDGKNITYVSNENNGIDFDVFVKNINTNETRCIFKNGGWCVSFGFSPDSSHVVVGQNKSLIANDLLLINLDKDKITNITGKNDISAHYNNICWIKDSSGFYLVSNKDDEFKHIKYYDLKLEKFSIFYKHQWDIEEISLSPDNTTLALFENEDGYTNIYLHDLHSKEIQKADLSSPGITQSLRWGSDNTKLIWSHETPTEVSALWEYDIRLQKANKVVEFPQKIDSSTLITPEVIRYKSFDDLTIPAFLYLPKRKSSKKIPVIIYIHGGPEYQYQPLFNPVIQFFLHKGYAVAAPNVRGSTGYGKEYVSLDDKEKRLDSVQDIVYLKEYLSTIEQIDSNKCILMGGSYGGYMVLANLAFYPEHWLAGVDIVGMANLVTFLQNTSSWRRTMREAEYGSLSTDKELLESISPLNKVDNIKAPLLIIHGANDPRVPLSEAEQMHDTLKELNRDVELLVFEDEGHGIAKTKNRIETYTKVDTFLQKHVGDI